MNISLITRRQLEIINRKTLRYPLAIAEKDYFLALVCKIIYNSTLKNKLIFKGGTAIYHTYLPQLRFSEDLDFSSNQAEINPQEIRSIFNDHNFLSIKKDYLSQATYKIERLL
ncbi:nucleotidyl transferase AbiEii/AbiGii toxin family protein, partial [Patescibacteria group bacterium]|nr:nucleotidyl transferase AbiEii/AbiGii toxin family protein [Patescibacteria group bacterium]